MAETGTRPAEIVRREGGNLTVFCFLLHDTPNDLRTEAGSPDLASLVDLKFFCGFSFAEIGALQKISERTVQRRWEKARIYLRQSIQADLSL